MDNGASGSGYNEAERVRTLANRMKALGGSSVILGDQSKKWLDYGLYNSVDKSTFDCAIELHMDSASASAKGGHVIIKSGFSADKYDKALETFIKGYFPGRSNTLVGRSDLGVVNACANRGINFRLLEVCFISNSSDISKFNSNVDAVAKGILAAFGISASSTTTTTTEGEYDMVCTYKISGGDGTVYYYDGAKLFALGDINEYNLLKTIYKSNVGKDMPLLAFTKDQHNHLNNVLKKRGI
ncbi:N-acetylmuramoyl-L-alanine amidase [Popillia japonica]|uniref:N-acetylmuramoyl-L-alanine amidase n=1 Tax=Popillia japonica TaxID=7064 RepID=A0AAW1HW14_POPJA